MDTLPLRIQGFLDALAAISHGLYCQGGLDVNYPASFDRSNLEVIYSAGDGSQRSGGCFARAEIEEIAEFFCQALTYSRSSFVKEYKELAKKFVALVTEELPATELEVWHHEGGSDAMLSVCISPGPEEKWLELFWSVD